MKKLQENLFLKVIAWILCVVLAAGAGGLGVMALYAAQRSGGGYQATEDYYYQSSEDADAAWMLFLLHQFEDYLNADGKAMLAEYTQELDQSETNFRFCICSEATGRVQDVPSGSTFRLDQLDNPVTEISTRYYSVEGNLDSLEPVLETTYADALYQYYTDELIVIDGTSVQMDVQLTAQDEEIQTLLALLQDTGGYYLQFGITEELTVTDAYEDIAQTFAQFRDVNWQGMGIVAAVMAVGAMLMLAWVLIACGHKKGEEQVVLVGLHRLPADLVFCGGMIVPAILLCVVGYSWDLGWIGIEQGMYPLGILAALISGFSAAIALLVLTTVTAQGKAHQFIRRLIVVKLLRALAGLTHRVRLFWKALAGVVAFLLVYAICVLEGHYSTGGTLLTVLLFCGALALTIWWLLGWKRVETGAKALAEGNLTYQIDLKKLPWDLKRHAQALNAIGGGMEKAVAERMKSESFRTELITNVSHDLKTPLTSIINYVDLLKKRDILDPTAQEYIEVLDRKSQRLKTLAEDLVEASKAASGVLSVSKEPLEAGQLIRQALGEYEEKFAAVKLTPVLQLPDGETWIAADGRHLWRILDNLFNNCVKYAMPGTRVYVSLLCQSGQVQIAVKNISAAPLNIPAENLMERFVRGDESRTTQGSGLGLSIANSLANLQGAEFKLWIDGDLFKAMVVFRDQPIHPPVELAKPAK